MNIALLLSHERFFNDVAEELRLFFPNSQITTGADGEALMSVRANSDSGVFALFERGIERAQARLPYPFHGDELIQKRLLKRAYKLAAYRALKELYGRPSPWGSLTGIRPTKFLRGLIGETQNAYEALVGEFDVVREKAALLGRVLKTQELLLHSGGETDVYIGIPFCASRCSYCSFAAQVPKSYDIVTDYLDALFLELDMCENALKSGVRSLYIGGGTPTALNSADFERLLIRARALSPALEFAVEAGRPDTLDTKKLELMAKYEVTRTSVNPQTMSDETLSRIGRRHTCADVIRAFGLVKKYGLPVNADIIIGLPGETSKELSYTLDRLGELDPEGFTAHTLALKRASRLVMDGSDTHTHSREAEAMLEMTQRFALDMGMNPYYLYRQKYMAGNLENVGYAKPGYECLYNIDIMEETTSILAFGAGAITKRIFGGGRLERQPNPKDVETYIAKVPELAARKNGLTAQ